MNNSNLQQARFSNNYKYIIDSDGKKLNYDDPRVVHFWAGWEVPYFSDIIKNIFKKRRWRYRTAGKITHKTIEDARKVCSGKECMGSTAFAGAIYNDIVENRDNDEVTLYYFLNQQGPCQNGVWPDMWNIFAARLGIKNAIFNVYPIITNNFQGQGNKYGMELIVATALGDIFNEAENVIKCLAKDKDDALIRFAMETEEVVDSFKSNLRAVNSALKQWVKQVSKIPLKGAVADVPKVMIFGTVEVWLLHDPVTDYFIRQGIIPKILDRTGFVYCVNAEFYSRDAYRRGKIIAKDQAALLPFMLSMYDPRTDLKVRFMAMKSGLVTLGIDALRKRYHGIAKKSGLTVSDKYISLETITLDGNTHATVNSITETFPAVGVYISDSNSGVYDGMMHLCSFNCQASVNSQAIIRPMAAKKDLPYAAIDMEGPWLSASQTRVLEALSVQMRRYHAQR
jgi:hypothetical protein